MVRSRHLRPFEWPLIVRTSQLRLVDRRPVAPMGRSNKITIAPMGRSNGALRADGVEDLRCDRVHFAAVGVDGQVGDLGVQGFAHAHQ